MAVNGMAAREMAGGHGARSEPREAVLPGYVSLYKSGELAERVCRLNGMLASCELCPRRCGVDRAAGAKGACGTAGLPVLASAYLHPWEEPPLSGERGSGTLFFSGCTMRCVFCQNFPISQLGVGRELTVEVLALEMLKLQRRGAHNLNLVTGTHQMAFVLDALMIAVPLGLRLPLVCNTSGYESIETLRLLEGIVDVYLPDIKYSSPEVARFCSGCPDYVDVNRMALKEMWRQVGPLEVDGTGMVQRGMLVRHMVLPEDLSGTGECLSFLAEEMGPSVWVSLLSQYFPAHEAHGLPPLDRRITEREYEAALEHLDRLGIVNGFVQDDSCGEAAIDFETVGS
ncbi:MAG: radical SAM protein [Syntrophobacteraceae bacterium]|jgi:putative pyruvate formate lyase activating enzyme|nr:radical SAM protein [Syntrophobacteraceae bacterium]